MSIEDEVSHACVLEFMFQRIIKFTRLRLTPEKTDLKGEKTDLNKFSFYFGPELPSFSSSSFSSFSTAGEPT